jgi:lactoylglutathione lyase
MRILHTMIRVGNLERAVNFYCHVLGMRELHRKEFAEDRFTLVFVGYAEIESSAVLELTYNWDTHAYHIGDGYGHIAIGVDDVYAACERIRNKGGKITVEPHAMQPGGRVLAFVEDPDGYDVELLEDKSFD